MKRNDVANRIQEIHEDGAPLDTVAELCALEALLRIMDSPLMGFLVTGGVLLKPQFADTAELAETIAKRAGSNCTVIELRGVNFIQFNVIQKIEVNQ